MTLVLAAAAAAAAHFSPGSLPIPPGPAAAHFSRRELPAARSM